MPSIAEETLKRILQNGKKNIEICSDLSIYSLVNMIKNGRVTRIHNVNVFEAFSG